MGREAKNPFFNTPVQKTDTQWEVQFGREVSQKMNDVEKLSDPDPTRPRGFFFESGVVQKVQNGVLASESLFTLCYHL